IHFALDFAVRREVNPTFFSGIRFPPPTPGPRILARTDGPAARRAADARIAFGIKRVARQVVLARVGFHPLRGPIPQRRELPDAAVRRVDLDPRYLGPAGALTAPQTGDPGVERAQFARQRAHLADLAAEHPLRHAVIEKIRPMDTHHGLDLARIWKHDLHTDAVAPVNLGHEVVGLLRQPAGIDGEDPDAGIEPRRHVEDHHSRRLKAGR